MLKLGVNIDHIATLREARQGINPEPCLAALICEAAGADSIVAHLREDRRHIKEKDAYLLKRTIRTRLNLEMSLAPDIIEIARGLKPDQATFVPEKRQELTTEGGLDVAGNFNRVKQAAAQLQKCGTAVSLFIDPEKAQIDRAVKAGVKMIELHTGRYADAGNSRQREMYFKQLKSAAAYAAQKGLAVFAGHGLDYSNAGRVAGIKEVAELNIGYAIICRAVMVGLERAVREMKAAIR